MNVLIAARTSQAAETLSRFLDGSGCEVSTATDGYTVRAIDLSAFDIIFVSVPLSEESGEELLSEIRERSGAHLFALVKEEKATAFKKRTAKTGAYIITKPLYKGALRQAIRFCENNLENEASLRAQVAELTAQLDEQKLVSRAKLLLVQGGMTEAQAHRHIQQTAMNRRLTQKEIAGEIIEKGGISE